MARRMATGEPVNPLQPAGTANAWEVLVVFLRLGFTSFGGPVAHLGFFRTEFVARRRWLGEQAFADLVALWHPSAWTQLGLVVVGAGVGLVWLPTATPVPTPDSAPLPHTPSRWLGGVWLAVCAAGLAVLPLLAQTEALAPGVWTVADAFYRTGALVFGGGHVVLPLLQAEAVQPGWVGPQAFLAGYASAQAVPGPLFTLAAFLGAATLALLRTRLPAWALVLLCAALGAALGMSTR